MEEKTTQERVSILEYSMKNTENKLSDIEKKIDNIMNNHLQHIQTSISEMGDNVVKKMEECFVSKDRFKPVEKIVYGLVGLVLISVFGAMIALILK